uniref:Uncharacterized protein n=1 Tax=Cacopsylla melanoneura TaxID=428564 RepID=A0A8D9E7B4_9HEMI
MLLVFRCTPNKTNISPAKRMMCRWLRCQIPNWNKYQEMISHTEVENQINENRRRIAQVYNRNCVKRRDIAEGEQIWYKRRLEDEKWLKGKILKDEGNRSYQIEDQNGAVYRRNEKFIKPNIFTESEEENAKEQDAAEMQVNSNVRPRRNVKPPLRLQYSVLGGKSTLKRGCCE